MQWLSKVMLNLHIGNILDRKVSILSKTQIGNICKINDKTYSVKDGFTYINYLDTGNITNNVIDNIQHIDLQKEKFPSRAKRKVQYNSIVYSTVRPNQRHFGIVKSQPNNFIVSTGFAVIDVDEKLADPEYVYYFLTQNDIVEQLQAIAEQSTSAYPSIKPSDIADLEIQLPSIETQKKVASILHTIDLKIENNTNINENLRFLWIKFVRLIRLFLRSLASVGEYLLCSAIYISPHNYCRLCYQ